MRKSISLLVVFILVVAMLSACATGDQTATQTASSEQTSESASASASVESNEGRTVTIMASQDWVGDAEMQLAEQFEEETGIHVDYQIIPSDQYPNLLTTKLNSGECADIFMYQSGKFDIVTLLQIEKNAVDLSSEEWVSRFNDAVKDQVSVDGKCYGVTTWDVGDSYAYIYNKKIFAENNLSVPTTFAEFKQVCQTLLDNGVTPMYECVADGWHQQLNFFDVSAAYDAADADMKAKLIANETTIAGNTCFTTMLEQMKEVVDAGYWGEDYMSNEYANLPTAMASGEFAITCNMMGRVSEIIAAGTTYTEDDFGFFPVPYLDNQVIAETPCGPSKFVFSGSENVDIAKQYLAFLCEPENLQYLIDQDSTFNSMPFSGLTSTYSAAITEAIETYKTGEATVYQNAVTYLNPQWMEIGSDLTAYLLGDMTVDEVVANIDQRRADQAAAASDPYWQ
jgi:raffinose/stachyose/melibiose transport system substrate-binding protein